MQIFTLAQVQTAQDYTPQIERFIVSPFIYVIETLIDYKSLPSAVQTMIDLRNQIG